MRRALTGILVLSALMVVVGCSEPNSQTSTKGAGDETSARAAPTLVSADSQFLYQYGPGFEAGGDLYLMNGDGSGTTKLDIDLPRIRISHSDWSPDGTKISFGVDTPDNCREIWVAAPDGVTDRRLVVPCDGSSPVGSDYSAWSPDGTALSYTSFGPVELGTGIPQSSTIKVLTLATGETRVVAASEPGELIDFARWSPDGESLVTEIDAFTDGAPSSSVIAVVPTSGGEPIRITEPELRAGYPDWSPDGDLISFGTSISAFFPDVTGASNIYTIAPDGNDMKQVTSFDVGGDRATQPSWLRDGSGIVFTWEVDREQTAAVVARRRSAVANQHVGRCARASATVRESMIRDRRIVDAEFESVAGARLVR